MAGLIFQKAQNAGAMRQQPAPLLVRHGVSAEGKTFYTHAPEGASADIIIEGAAKDSGGFVVKLFDPKLNAWEILAVKLGDKLLVKGDLTKILRADLSGLAPADRAAVLNAARISQGGLHIFIGEDGIPICVDKNGGLAFPNAEELRTGGTGEVIHISLVDYNFDPGSIRDLDSHYSGSGGVRVSEDAKAFMAGADRDEISRSHGGGRSERLMLDDNSVLILKMNSGEIVTMAENGIRAEGFAALKLAVPQFVAAGLVYQNESTRVRLPFDASRASVPYIFVKIFDGRITDNLKIFRPLELPSLLPSTTPLPPGSAVEDGGPPAISRYVSTKHDQMAPAATAAMPPRLRTPASRQEAFPKSQHYPSPAKAAAPSAARFDQPLPEPVLKAKPPLIIDLQVIKASWRKSRVSVSVKHAEEAGEKTGTARIVRMESEKPSKKRKEKAAARLPLSQAKKKAGEKEEPKFKKESLNANEIAKSKGRRKPPPLASDYKKLSEPRQKKEPPKAPGHKKDARPPPNPAKKSKEMKRPAKSPSLQAREVSSRRRKRANRHPLLEMLGLYGKKNKRKKPSRGRARAGSSG